MFLYIPSSVTSASNCVMLTAKKLGRMARSALVELVLTLLERVARLEQRLKGLEGGWPRTAPTAINLRRATDSKNPVQRVCAPAAVASPGDNPVARDGLCSV